jgi:hypothetical protein
VAHRLKLTDAQYDEIESKIGLNGEETYAIVVQKHRGKMIYGVHVFQRQPSTKELVQYEETASRVKYKGSTAELQGSALLAGVNMYNLLIVRAYDIVVGMKRHDELDRGTAIASVPGLQKREAVREFLGNVSSLTSVTSDDDDERDGNVVKDAE